MAYPNDRFDSVPDDLLRTGAHRAAPRRGRGWIAFAWAALATGVLVAAGLFGLSIIRGTIDLRFLSTPSTTASAAPSPSTPPTVEPKIDPTLAITVLNGTRTARLAAAAGDNLVAQGWSGASADVGTRTNAGSSDITKTVVYYSNAADEGAARALVLSLKIGEIRLSAVYPNSPLTVVLGSDYVLPAG